MAEGSAEGTAAGTAGGNEAPGGSPIGVGIDVGGTGIKVGKVDLDSGRVLGERIYVKTPSPSTPDAVAETIAGVLREMEWTGPVGIALPTVIHKGVAQIAYNIDESWIGTDVEELLSRHLPDNLALTLNDADAAGIAESYYGAAKGRKGLTLLLTLGTGIGSALLLDGRLVPNSELGHVLVRAFDESSIDETEHLAAPSLKEKNGWTLEEWAARIDSVLRQLEHILWPRLIVLGGGISEDSESWFPLLTNRTEVVAATRQNDAGMIGAAAYAAADGGIIDISSVFS
ncbi:polyphosphate--glucose phosphotransferase [Dietzia sp.]|uniref:polyphosphate--glucose phosphotransferase n=1 Tax=Dietzia sp. TaxID=1871616 RepID=UPI002FDA0D31